MTRDVRVTRLLKILLCMAIMLMSIGEAKSDSGRYLIETSGKGYGIGLSGGYTIVTELPNGKSYVTAVCYLYNNTEQTVAVDTKNSGLLFGTADKEIVEDLCMTISDISTKTIEPEQYGLVTCEGVIERDLSEYKYAAFVIFADPEESEYDSKGVYTATDMYKDGEKTIIEFTPQGLKSAHEYEVMLMAFDASNGIEFLWGRHITYRPESGKIKVEIAPYEKELQFINSGDTRLLAIVYEARA